MKLAQVEKVQLEPRHHVRRAYQQARLAGHRNIISRSIFEEKVEQAMAFSREIALLEAIEALRKRECGEYAVKAVARLLKRRE